MTGTRIEPTYRNQALVQIGLPDAAVRPVAGAWIDRKSLDGALRSSIKLRRRVASVGQ